MFGIVASVTQGRGVRGWEAGSGRTLRKQPSV